MTPKEILDILYNKEWWEFPELMKLGPTFHDSNLENCNNALTEFQNKKRPINILVIHGSGRSSDKSCAHERSNSQLLLEYGLKELDKEQKNKQINIDIINLRDYHIEPCNSCFIDPNTKVFGVTKWREIGDIKIHNGIYPSVLTHNGKFKSITNTPRPVYSGTIYKIVYKIFGKEYSTIVTKDHEFLVNGNWRRADSLTLDDKLQYKSLECKQCGVLFSISEKGGKNQYDCCSDKCRHIISSEATSKARKENPDIVDNIINAVTSNHRGLYKTQDCEILSIQSKEVTSIKTYCLTVEDDHSFIIDGGLISHNCVSTCSALCNYPCTCFPAPNEGMQQLYPKVLRSDILLLSTPVNQSMISTRLKAFLDRLISLDGGFLVDKGQYRPKDSKWRDICINISLTQSIEYAQRLHNRVASYFISGKDINNPLGDPSFDYVKSLSEALYSNFDDYGIQHPYPYFVASASKWDEDYAYDKQRLNDNVKVLNASKKLVRSAYNLALKLRKHPAKKEPGRVNRT